TQMAHDAGLVFRKSGRALPKSTVHRILRTRLYAGEFEWNGKVYKGSYEPIVPMTLWLCTPDVNDSRQATKRRKPKPSFTTTGLVRCGKCGYALSGFLIKGRYVYYHCPTNGTCKVPFVREAALDEAFATALSGLKLDAEFYAWLVQALKESHTDKEKY